MRKEVSIMEVTFKVSKWEEKPIDVSKENFPINSAHVEYELDGELKGKAYVEYLLFYLETNQEDGHLATSKISGYLHFEGTYQGKQGTFTAIEQGIFDKGNLNSPGSIIKATGDLEGLKGSYHYQFTGQTSKLVLDFTL
jgi:hypothetical protein